MLETPRWWDDHQTIGLTNLKRFKSRCWEMRRQGWRIIGWMENSVAGDLITCRGCQNFLLWGGQTVIGPHKQRCIEWHPPYTFRFDFCAENNGSYPLAWAGMSAKNPREKPWRLEGGWWRHKRQGVDILLESQFSSTGRFFSDISKWYLQFNKTIVISNFSGELLKWSSIAMLSVSSCAATGYE